MIRIRDIVLPPGHDPARLKAEAARLLRIEPSEILELTVFRRSIDARKKPEIRLVYTVDVRLAGNERKILQKSRCRRAEPVQNAIYRPPEPREWTGARPVIVGFGPGGMFAALILALAGMKPLVLERGQDAQARKQKVDRFFATGELDPACNVQFGEGGAGTFSDGKLNTGVNNPRIRWILEQMVLAGAREDILFDAKPHVGTDILVDVVRNIRRRVIALGGIVRFGAQVTGLTCQSGHLTGVVLADGETIPCTDALFAIGHSARDTFRMLENAGLPMEPKPFAMGVRIEHRQSRIDRAQYGKDRGSLPPADYKLVCHLPERTVYTFCMCPGGYVVGAASEAGGVVTNGMSNADRDGENANSALLVSVHPKDFPEPGPLGGMLWQRKLEEAAFLAGGGGYRAPAQRVGDFLSGQPSGAAGSVRPTYRPGVHWCDLHTVLPEPITSALEQGLPQLGKLLQGFDDPDAVLTAPESRSSSPVRILRGADRQSLGLAGFYPVGEGAGYAGGIMSASIDGIISAEALIEKRRSEEHG